MYVFLSYGRTCPLPGFSYTGRGQRFAFNKILQSPLSLTQFVLGNAHQIQHCGDESGPEALLAGL